MFIRNGPNRGDFSNNGHVHIHTRTPRITKLHRTSMHCDNDTDQKHNKSLQFRTHLDQYRNCLFRFSACQWMRSVDSLLVNQGLGRGSSVLLLLHTGLRVLSVLIVNSDDAMNVILDLQRDLHANDFGRPPSPSRHPRSRPSREVPEVTLQGSPCRSLQWYS